MAERSKHEILFETTWPKYSPIPMTPGGVGSLKIIGITGTCRSQVDFYNEKAKVIIELHGATHKGRNGAHTSASGVRRDMLKQMLAQAAGWLFFELDSTMLKDPHTLSLLAFVVECRATGKTLNLDQAFAIWESWRHLMPRSRAGTRTKLVK